MIDSLLNMLLSFALLGALYLPLEWSFRARAQSYNRPGMPLDLCYFCLQFMIVLGISLSFVDWLGDHLRGPAIVTVTVYSWPRPLQMIFVVICADLAQYWGHRLAHSVPLLWRFHGVHHTSTRLDWLAAYREHPIDGLYSQLLLMGPAAFLGIHPLTIMPLLVFRGLWAVLVHTNTRLPLGPLGILLGDPVLHRWHHAKRITEHNYANLAPYLDVIFGTHYRPQNEDFSLGVEGDFPRTFIEQLIPGWARVSAAVSPWLEVPATFNQKLGPGSAIVTSSAGKEDPLKEDLQDEDLKSRRVDSHRGGPDGLLAARSQEKSASAAGS